MDARDTRSSTPIGPFVIEALEDDHWAMLEDERGHALEVPRSWLPVRAREGDVVTIELTPAAEGTVQHVVFSLDAAATEARRRAMGERHERLPRAPSGDLDL